MAEATTAADSGPAGTSGTGGAACKPVDTGGDAGRAGDAAGAVTDGASVLGCRRRLIKSKGGTRVVHGRSAAGGPSQHRFARRRDNQATAAITAAADTAVKVLVPYAERLDAVVLGGDRKAVSAARADPRLRP